MTAPSGHLSVVPDVTTSDTTEGDATIPKASDRTIRRHKAKGTIPASFRKIGRDGRSYAARPPAPTSSGRCDDGLARDLAAARAALRRADRTARFGQADVDELQRIVEDAGELLADWREERAAALRDRVGSQR